jgi:ABC-type amino acid transport substrate-binding protein
LGGANFNGANLDNTNLTAIEIRQTNFRSASLKNAIFLNAVLDAVNFQDADLSGADFTGATLRGVLLQGAILCNTRLPDGTTHLCPAVGDITVGAAKPEDERLLMKSSVKFDKAVRISVAGNAFANFQKGRPSGIFTEIVSQIARDMGQEPAFISMPADAALKALEEGRLDVATVILKTDKIQTKFLFSEPIITDYQVVVVKKGNTFPLMKQSDLEGKRLGARQGYRYDLLGKGSRLRAELYQSDGEMIRALLLGEVDAILMSGISDVYALRSEGIMSQLEVLRASVGRVPLLFAFSKTRFSADDVMHFNQRLEALNQQGVWRELAEKNGMGDLIDPFPVLAP